MNGTEGAPNPTHGNLPRSSPFPATQSPPTKIPLPNFRSPNDTILLHFPKETQDGCQMAFTVGPAQPRNLLLTWRGVFFLLATLIAAVWALGLLQDILRVISGAGEDDMVWVFDADSEEGVLTWISIVLLFSVAGLLFANGQAAMQNGRDVVLPWFGLSVLFGIVSFDEFYGLHERLSDVLFRNVGGSGLFHFAWVVPLGLLAVAGLWLLMPFLTSLGPRTRRLAVLSAMVYLTGAVGMEMLAGLVIEELGRNTFQYRLLTNAEEGLEVSGILLFIYTLQQYREAPGRA